MHAEGGDAWNAWAVVGKSAEHAYPVTYAVPVASTAMASPPSNGKVPWNVFVPPSKTEQRALDPSMESSVMNATEPFVFGAPWETAPLLGKSEEEVVPVT